MLASLKQELREAIEHQTEYTKKLASQTEKKTTQHLFETTKSLFHTEGKAKREIEMLQLKLEKIEKLDDKVPDDICRMLQECKKEMLKVQEDEKIYANLEEKTKLLETEREEKKKLEDRLNAELAIKVKELKEKEDRFNFEFRKQNEEILRYRESTKCTPEQ